MAAARQPAIAATVADSAFSSVETMIANQFNTFVRLPPLLAPLVTFFGEQIMGLRASQIVPVQEIARISPRPVLLIHGEQDSVVYAQNSRDLFAWAREPKELWIVPGAGHCGALAAAPQEWEQRVIGFFERWLGVSR